MTAPLTDLLGETRAQIVVLLHTGGATVAELTEATGLTHEAVRRHLRALVADDLATGDVERSSGRGRPAVRYCLTARGERLFPDRSADLADDVLTFLHDERGRGEMHAFLRWRQMRQQQRYTDALGAGGDLAERVRRLAELLSEDGFLAEVTVDDDGYALVQQHCAIKDVAAEHPQLCAFEAALFRQLLGANVTRRQTIAGGANACVCRIHPARDPRAARSEQSQSEQSTTPRGATDGHHG